MNLWVQFAGELWVYPIMNFWLSSAILLNFTQNNAISSFILFEQGSNVVVAANSQGTIKVMISVSCVCTKCRHFQWLN